MKFALQWQAEREKIEMQQLQADRELSNMTHNNPGFIGARTNNVASVQKLLPVMHDTCDVLTFFVGLRRALELNNVKKESWGKITSLTIKSPGTQGFHQSIGSGHSKLRSCETGHFGLFKTGRGVLFEKFSFAEATG